MLPRILGMAVVVGIIAFLAGFQFAQPRALSPAVSAAMPDRSSFATAFDPMAVLREAGMSGCAGRSNARAGGGRSYVIASMQCPVQPAQQSPLILKLEGQISTAIRERAVSRDRGLAGVDGNGPTVMSWDYRSNGFDGSVYLVVTRAGSDLQLVIVLDEQIRA
jgi:hypothetical protein